MIFLRFFGDHDLIEITIENDRDLSDFFFFFKFPLSLAIMIALNKQ